MPRLNDIPLFPRAHYTIDVPWTMIESTLKSWGEFPGGVQLDPEYQREHVWTTEQQTAYVEYMLQGGEISRVITWNCSDWNGLCEQPIELVDGKQRLEAVRAFMRGDIKAFGYYIYEYSDRDHMRIHLGFKFSVCTLPARNDVLQLYLNINAGGTPHTAEELSRVRSMLERSEG